MSFKAVAVCTFFCGHTTAEIVSTVGAAEITPPPSVQPGAIESNTQAFIFRENPGFQLAVDLDIDISQSGTVTSSPATPGTIAAGTAIESYYLQFDKVGETAAFATANGSVTFNREILGLIVFNDGLDATDSILGSSATLYPTASPNRGIIAEQRGNDSLTLTADRKTLQFTLETANRVDSLRIITVPEPNALLLSSIALLGGFLLRRRDAV